MTPTPVFFLGGHDAEMQAIRELLLNQNLHFHDKNLSWGADAIAYAKEIRSLDSNANFAVLIELSNQNSIKLPPNSLLVDHHGESSGKDMPSSLEQITTLVGLSKAAFESNRLWQLIAANDIAHVKGMRSLDQPASDAEVFKIRMMDLSAQGVSDRDMEIAKLDAKKCQNTCRGKLSVVEASTDRTGLVAEMMEPFFGGPGFENLLVVGPTEFGFFGNGKLVLLLSNANPESWYGGALPENGFWGCKLESITSSPQSVLENLLNG